MELQQDTLSMDHVLIHNPQGKSSIVVVCEHASHFIPDHFSNLGLSKDELKSHIAWDPGAMSVAQRISNRLNAALVASDVSRLVYDCNRPPSAQDAMPAQSEMFIIPGNSKLTAAQRAERAKIYYEPFRESLATTLSSIKSPIIVTIHSFTQTYHGKQRQVEIGVLHDADARLADSMLQVASTHTSTNVQRNEPYGPQHGVTHTLKEHALDAGYLNVMLEIRNDLIQTSSQQEIMGDVIADWLYEALGKLGVVM